METATLDLAQTDHLARPVSSQDWLELGEHPRWRPEDIERASGRPGTALRFSADAYAAMRASCDALHICIDRGDPVYGLTTGYGPHVCYAASNDPHDQGDGLIAHLGAGWGEPISAQLVRAMMLLRLQTVAQGRSGIDPDAADTLLAVYNAGIAPAVPCVGSVGASGDLIPMAHVARVITGVGEVLGDSGIRPAREALDEAGITPRRLSGRDALSIVNGTSFMTAHAAIAIARADRLVSYAELLTGWAYRLLGCRSQALDDRLHKARGHRGQIESASRIRVEAERYGPYEDTTRPLQEVYSLRCAPQFLGAVREQLDHARRLVTTEINGVSDNPVICHGDEPAVLHGGNFQGQQIAFASDTMSQAMTQVGLLMERQIDVLCNPELTGATLLLAWRPGATSGLAGAQITATAIAAEMRHQAQPAAISTIPTNGRNQDVVSMGAMAARVAHAQTNRLAAILAILSIAMTQLDFLRREGTSIGRRTPKPEWLPKIDGFTEDRPLRGDIERLSQFFLT